MSIARPQAAATSVVGTGTASSSSSSSLLISDTNDTGNESAIERLLLKGNDDIIWCAILDHFADDAATLARFSAVSKGCRRQVFVSLRSVLVAAAPSSTAAPNAKTSVAATRPIEKRNDSVLPLPLLELWWTDRKDDDEGVDETDSDKDGNAKKRRRTNHDDDANSVVATQYDRLEGLGYYQAVVRAGLLRKKRVVTLDRFSKARVPHSALRMEHMSEILVTGGFRRSRSLYERAFPAGRRAPPFEHDSFYEPDCRGGIVYCLALFMVWEKIFPDFDNVDVEEHCNIIQYPERKKYRECELYKKYMAAVPYNLFHLSREVICHYWSTLPLTLRLLVAAENQTTVKW